MNTFANLLPSVGGNRPPLSDEELRRLAEMLQQRGEGLAAINPQEAQMLKDAGGSGKPLPGTQGLGMNGGPIRTYEKEDGRIDEDHRLAILTDAEVEALNYLKHQDQEQGFQSGNGPLVQALASMNTDELDYHNVNGMNLPSLNDFGSDGQGGTTGGGGGDKQGDTGVGENRDGNGGNGGGGPIGPEPGGPESTPSETSEQQKASEQASIEGQAKAHNENTIRFETDQRVIQEYNRQKQSQGGGDGGSQQQQQQQQKPKFYDSLGGVHDTQEAADAATQKIVGQQNALEAYLKKELTSDMDFETFSEQFFKEREKVTPGKKVQVQTGGRPETFEEFVARSNLPSYSDYSKKLTEGNKTFQQWKDVTKPETFEQYVARVGSSFQETGEDGQPVTVEKSRREMIREYNEFLYQEYLKTFVNAPTQEEYNSYISQQYEKAKTDGTLQIIPTYTTQQEAPKTETIREADGFELLPESEVERIFNIAMKTVQAETTLQTEQFRGNVIELFNNGTFTARGKRVRNQQGEIVDVVPTTFAEADAKLSQLYPDSFGRLSESQKRAVLQDALEEFARIEAFTLTMEDVDRFTRPAPKMGAVDDITATDIATVADATETTVGAVDDVTQTTLDEVLDVASDAGELSDVIDEEDALIEVLKSRVAGDEPSVAEIQLKRGTEQNLKALLATTAGVMDPTKLRQTRNMWMDIQQIFTGQKAELRAAEQVQAEQNLLAVLKAKGTREASIQIANMEKDIQMSIAQGNLDQARKIQNQQAALTLVTVQAEIEKDVRLANLDKERIIAIEEGKLDLATKIANLEKEILIAKVNAQLALDSRKMDDAIAIAAYQGEQALAGVEVEIDLAEMKADLTTAGFELQKDLALMDRETKLAVARLVGELKAEQASADRDSDRINGLISAIATVGATYLRFKTGV